MKKLPKVFIVEDDPFYATLLEREITNTKAGRVRVFHSGEKFLDNLYKMPEIVLLDHNLGSMKGIEVLKQIKSVNPNIQVIFLSAQEKLQVAITALKFGAYDYVEKNKSTFTRVLGLINRINKFNRLVEEQRQYKVVKIVLAIILSGMTSFAAYIHFFNL